MKSFPSKSMKTGAEKKRSRDEASGSAEGSMPPTSLLRPNPNKKWKKSKAKTEDLLALLNSGFLREKEVDMWRAATGDPYPMEKNPDEVPMFARFVERGLALPASEGLPSLSSSTSAKPSWDQASLGFVSKVLPLETTAERQRPKSSRRSRHLDARRRRQVVLFVQAHRFQPRQEFEVVLHHQPPPGTAEAEREAAEASALVKHRVDDPGGYSTIRAAVEDQGFERSGAEGRTCGLQLHEEEGGAADGS
jgi:hypothetical protein